jgi:uncharacterized RmlC-like cupin family protein
MVPYEKQVVTVVRQGSIGTDVTYEPPLRIGFGISDKTVDNPNATMGRSILVPGAGPNPTHYHAENDVVWYILYGKIKLWHARSDASERQEVILEGGDFVYVPAGAIHVIANASETEEASLIFCYIGVPSTDAAKTIWLSEDGKTRLQPESELA